ncbi:MAG TPA: hypothetical protein VKV15_26735 [Bryobacteraceae bacterium]|nr:hypothetical protein [Bryobacteraceae bacterium]
MTAIPIELPVRANESAALADLIFQHAEGKPLTEEARNRLATRAASLRLQSVIPYFGSLQHDPVHPSTYYIAVDAQSGGKMRHLLLHLALASSPASALFPHSVLIGRMRIGGGPEIVANAIPFAHTDRNAIRTFAEEVDRDFLPRSQGTRPAISAGDQHPDISLPAAFQAYRTLLKSANVNLAAIVGVYDSGLWAAIRSGWREGYTAEAEPIVITGTTNEEVAQSVSAAKDRIESATGFTKFSIDASALFDTRADTHHPDAWSDTVVAERFERLFTEKERHWIRGEFAQLDPAVVVRIAIKFGLGLRISEELHDTIRRSRATQESWRNFDFELVLGGAQLPTTPLELSFCLHWLKARGRAAQFIAPNLGLEKSRYRFEVLQPLAHEARRFGATLSVRSGLHVTEDVLSQIGKATGGRVHYNISGELQLQIFDVLAEQPPGSEWRALFDRMQEQTGDRSDSRSLGDPYAGRADGNPILASRLGEVVEERDHNAPDGDERTFMEKLGDLPPKLISDVRQRNTRYILWLAENLRG